MTEHKAYHNIPGRKTKRAVSDYISEGIGTIIKEAAKYQVASLDEMVMEADGDEADEANLEQEVTAEDVSIDLIDDI